MERPPSINGPDLARTLEAMGFRLDYSAGQYRVYVHSTLDNKVIVLEERWDMPWADIEDVLRANDVPPDEFYETWQTLFNK